VVGSRGSVVPVFIKQRHNGSITITDERMTRFWMSLEKGVRFVISCIEEMRGGEVFVPKIPSMAIMDLAKVVAPQAKVNITGIRPGEKLHEVLISEDEARTAVDLDDRYVVMPSMELWTLGNYWQERGCALEDGFRYASNTNPEWLSVEQIQQMVAPIEVAYEQGRLE
jgi:UDP-N-acetylglucosamine 4,6-dehydratase